MNRTIIYGRVSTEDQLERYGMPAQLRACREYASAHGLSVIEEITDEGISGTVLDRPGLSRVRQLVMSGAVDVVLMLDADRLSRELAHLLILKPEIERKARLEFVTAKFEDSPSGRMFFGIRGVIAQYERELTRERTMRGKKERALAGRIVGGRTAYGYRYEDGKLYLDPDRAAAVRDIYSWFDSGLSLRAIASKLRDNGVPTYSGRRWGRSSVRRILANETYAGVAHYGTHRREGKVLRLRESADRIALEVPSIVSRDQWQRIQARLVSSPQVGRPSASYLLRGLLACSCGRHMRGEKTRGYHSYRCNGRDRLVVKGEHCTASINAKLLDAAVWQVIAEAFTDASFLRRLLADHQRELQDLQPDRLDALRRQARKLKSREETSLAALLDPDLAPSRPAIKAEYCKAQRDRQQIEGELAALESRSRGPSAGEWLEETTALLHEYIPTLVLPEDRQQFIRGLVTRAEWASGEVTLTCFLGAEIARSSGRCADFERLQVILKARVAA